MFASPQLAARVDIAEGRLCAVIARAVGDRFPEYRPCVFKLSGGVAVFAGAHSPSNKMIGVGFEEQPGDRDLSAVESAFDERVAALQGEISTLADPGLHARLVARGYQPRGFENVLGHPLSTTVSPSVDHIRIDRVEPGDLAEWAEVVVTAFSHPDSGGVGGDAIPLDDELRKWFDITMRVPGFEGFLARIDGQIVGGGSLRIDEGVAQFCGASTLPAFRRRGVQTALLHHRLAFARTAGCDIAVVTTQPASKSQMNVQREGFQLLYARQLLIRNPRPAAAAVDDEI
jgi:GNAT superfamily N-acetyltransferase